MLDHGWSLVWWNLGSVSVSVGVGSLGQKSFGWVVSVGSVGGAWSVCVCGLGGVGECEGSCCCGVGVSE